jgi:DNA-directed RNA polymerase specialized sigma24 family protein
MYHIDLIDYLSDGNFSKTQKEKAALAAALEAKDAALEAKDAALEAKDATIEASKATIEASKATIEASKAENEALQKQMKSVVFKLYAKGYPIKEISETLEINEQEIIKILGL